MRKDEFTNMIKSVFGELHGAERLPVPILAAKARRFAQANPTDVPVVTAANVLSKMEHKETFIKRADFNKLIDGLHNTQTKLAQIFSEEMQKEESPGPVKFARDDYESMSLDRSYEMTADPVMRNALSNVFDDEGPVKLYSEAQARKAQKACRAGLLAMGLEPKTTETFAGQDDLMLIAASYETPKGDTRVLVPIEMKQGMALLPTMFISQAGFTDLSRPAVESHIRETAGKSLRVNGEKVLQVLSLAKNGVSEVASDVDLAVMQLRSKNKTAAGDVNGIIGIQIDNPEEDISLDMPKTAEELSFAERMTKPEGMAKFLHGERVVEAGHRMMQRKMRQFGYGGAQIKIADVEQDKIVFAVNIANDIGFTVPVKVQANAVLPPTILISNGELKSFSTQGVGELVKSGASDTRALAMASRHYELRPSQLVEMVKEACLEGNFAKAEDCINVLGEIDPQAQKVAIANMMIAIKNEHGIDPQEEMSNMKAVAESPVYDVPMFMTHKVFFPEGA